MRETEYPQEIHSLTTSAVDAKTNTNDEACSSLQRTNTRLSLSVRSLCAAFNRSLNFKRIQIKGNACKLSVVIELDFFGNTNLFFRAGMIICQVASLVEPLGRRASFKIGFEAMMVCYNPLKSDLKIVDESLVL